MAEFRFKRAPFGRSLSKLRNFGPQAIDPTVLAEEMREYSDVPLPEDLRIWLADYLAGDIRPKRGRPARPASELLHRKALWQVAYNRYLTWLQERKSRDGHLDGWSCIRAAGWWQGAPSERAARMVAERFGEGHRAWRSVQTTLSKKL